MAESRYLAPDSPFLGWLLVTRNQQEPAIIEDRRFSQVHKLKGSELYYQRGARSWKEGVCEATEDRLGSTAWDLGSGRASRQRAAGGWGRVKVPRPPTSAVASHLVPSNLHQSSGPPALGTYLLHSFMARTKANSDLVRGRGIASQQSCDTCPNLSPK